MLPRRLRVSAKGLLAEDGGDADWGDELDRAARHLAGSQGDDPPLRLAGVVEPIEIRMHFDRETADAIVERLTLLRSGIPPVPEKRN